MSFAFRTTLIALLLVAAQSTYALDTNSDSVSAQARELAERAANAPRADKYTGSLVPKRVGEPAAKHFPDRVLPRRSPHNERSGAGMAVYEKGQAQKDAVTTHFGSEKGVAKYLVSAFKQASAPNGTCPGEVINYTIQLTNDSNSAAGSAASFMSDFLDFDGNLIGTPVATSGVVDYDALDHEVFWNGSLAPNGGMVTITFSVIIKDVPDGTLITNNPFFEFVFAGDSFQGNLDGDVELEVVCGGGGTIRALGTKSAFSPFGGCPGDPIFYTITLTNLSDDIIGELSAGIFDQLDADVNIDSISATDIDFNDLGDLDVDFGTGEILWLGSLDVFETVFIDIVAIIKDVPDWTPIENDPLYGLGPLEFLLPIPIVIPTICTDFIIDEGVTGSYGDSVYNGQGINVEILAKDEDGFSGLALVYWYSYDSFGLPFFAFGVGTYEGSIMIVDMLFDYDGGGPFFGPGWINGQFDPFGFTDVILLWKDCNKLGFFFLDLPGLLALDFPWYLQNMDRITQVAGLPCPFQSHPPLGDKQLAPVRDSVPQQAVRPPLKPLFDALPDSSLDRAGGRERVYEKLGLNAAAAKPAPSSELGPEPVVDEVEKGAFEIPVGMTGSFYDPNFNGQGINLEILSLPSADKGGGLVLMYWYTFDINGFPMFVFGVGSFTGNTMVFNMLVDWDGNGPFFGPLWNVNQFIPVAFATASIVWSGCDSGVMNFTMHPVFSGFGFVAHIMNLERITEISKLPCVE